MQTLDGYFNRVVARLNLTIMFLQDVQVSAVALVAFSTLSRASHVSIPLKHHRGDGNVIQQASHAASRLAARSAGVDVHPEPLDFGPHNWWYGNFDVG